jgi:exoribonuclease R
VVHLQRREWDSACYAIDESLSAMDIDDAISYSISGDGTEWVHVHVADVGRLVKPASVLDVGAAGRCSTVYLFWRTPNPETSIPDPRPQTLRKFQP